MSDEEVGLFEDTLDNIHIAQQHRGSRGAARAPTRRKLKPGARAKANDGRRNI